MYSQTWSKETACCYSIYIVASVWPYVALLRKSGCWKSRHGASDCMPPVFSPVELRGRCPMAERLSAAGLLSKLPGRWVWLAHHKPNDPRGKATEPWPSDPQRGHRHFQGPKWKQVCTTLTCAVLVLFSRCMYNTFFELLNGHNSTTIPAWSQPSIPYLLPNLSWSILSPVTLDLVFSQLLVSFNVTTAQVCFELVIYMIYTSQWSKY